MGLEGEGIVSYEIHQTEGIREVVGIGEAFRSPAAKGGLNVVLLQQDGSHAGYMWLRPSGTESVLRVLVDLRGDRQDLHDRLLSWQRSLIEEADSALE